MFKNVFLIVGILTVVCILGDLSQASEEKSKEEKGYFQGQKLAWKDDDGLEIKITRPIHSDKCEIQSQAGDVVHQFYALHDAEGKEIGSNFGKTP